LELQESITGQKVYVELFQKQNYFEHEFTDNSHSWYITEHKILESGVNFGCCLSLTLPTSEFWNFAYKISLRSISSSIFIFNYLCMGTYLSFLNYCSNFLAWFFVLI
jgi:hypothetical protein